jgi:MoaA/NifB/PqqE/SkfB family radical SAM enzyme
MSENYLATRYRCSWPWNTAVMLCDGRVVCGCADPYGKRVLGDARTETITQIWTGPTASKLREELNAGGSSFCGDCPLKLPLADDEMPPQRPLDVSPLPSRMYFESTAACNVSCLDSCCAPETGITKTRQAGMLDVDLFLRVLGEVGPTLERVDFFNYGEAFLHKRAVEMCETIKRDHPHIYLYTSTNGGALNEESARRLVRTGIDELTFSVDGASQDVYATYRQRGKFEHVMKNLRAVMDEKRKLGTDVPFVNWRYILFNWNDNDAEMSRARRLAAEIGVDRLCWEITDHPEHAYSRRFAPGTDDWRRIRHEVWDDNHLGSAIPGTTPRARIEVRGPSRDETIVHAAGQPLALDLRVRNLSQRAFPHTATYGRRLVRVGAQLLDAERELRDRDFVRASLPATVDAGAWQDLRLEIPPMAPGHYHLKLDLVSEGIDWFESCGSEVTLRELRIE